MGIPCLKSSEFFCTFAAIRRNSSLSSPNLRTTMEVIDCRSDTVTVPSDAMRKAMAEAKVGDDVFGEDPTVQKLERAVAEKLGKEAGLFVPSGTMGNFVSVMTHCWGRGLEIILGDKAHIQLYEQGNIAQFAGVHHRTVKNNPNGTFSIDELRSKIRHGADEDPHYPITSLVCIENSHNNCGGRAVPLDWIEKLAQTCKEFNLPIHCDGARLFNTAVALNVPASKLVEHCDSVSVCLSKGLGCPIGSVIVGRKEFIGRATRMRKAIGGGMRQVGIIAAAGLYAIENNINRLNEDHINALKVAEVIKKHGGSVLMVDESTIDTNLLYATVDDQVITALKFVERLEKTTKNSADNVSLQILDVDPKTIRIAFHLNVTREMTEKICQKLIFVLQEIKN